LDGRGQFLEAIATTGGAYAAAGSHYETFAIEIGDRWRQRVGEQRWPQFTAR
jgi:hypothetical protein